MQIEVYDTERALADAAAHRIARLLQVVPTTFGLAGGATPAATYERLRDVAVPWRGVTCWLPDERWVPPDDPASNAAMTRFFLTDHVPARLIAPDTTVPAPGDAAADYHHDLEAVFDGGPGVVLLGVGADGHTASLFPGSEAVANTEPAYVADWVATLGAWRLTATAPLLHRSAHILFLVSGAAKAEAVRRILVDEEPLPARVVADGARDVTWLLDAAAAAGL